MPARAQGGRSIGTTKMMTGNGTRGYTLFELMLVLVMASGALLVALPTLGRSQQVYELTAASNGLRSRLSYARIQAISQNMDHRIRVVNSTSYVLERRPSIDWVVAQTYPMASGFSVSASGTAEFHPRGTANPAATFTVTNGNMETRQIVVSASGYINAQ